MFGSSGESQFAMAAILEYALINILLADAISSSRIESANSETHASASG